MVIIKGKLPLETMPVDGLDFQNEPTEQLSLIPLKEGDPTKDNTSWIITDYWSPRATYQFLIKKCRYFCLVYFKYANNISQCDYLQIKY